MTTKQSALGKEKPFPFIIVEGNLKLPGDSKMHLAADINCCSFSGSVVEAACALLACYYLFMFNHPIGLKNLFPYCKNVFKIFMMARSCQALSYHYHMFFFYDHKI